MLSCFPSLCPASFIIKFNGPKLPWNLIIKPQPGISLGFQKKRLRYYSGKLLATLTPHPKIMLYKGFPNRCKIKRTPIPAR